LAGTETCVSAATWGTDQLNPAIWDDRIIWAHYYPSLEDPEIYYTDLIFYNTSSGKIMRIPTILPYQDMPDIWEDRIVWQTYEDDNFEIHLYNLSTGKEQRITNDQVNQVTPQIWGDWIVWQEGIEGESECSVHWYDINSGSVTKLGDISSSSARSPAIWGDRVVWEDARNASMGNFEIYLFNITSGNETQITTDPYAQMAPAIWEDRIVWMDNRDVSSQIYLYDLLSGEETRITEGDYYRESPVISGDIVAYINDTVVTCIDITTMTESPVSSDATRSPKYNPAIWGERVIWSDMRNGDFDVFLYTFGTSMPPLVADYTSNVTQGKAPITVQFTDTTEGQNDGCSWDFGDGVSSTEKNPVHTYDSAGSYTVVLTVYNPFQRAAVRKDNFISAGSDPVPQFTQNRTCGPAPLAVAFEDTSSGLPFEWHWDFGDKETSDEQNPVHVFTHAGVYDVNLTVANIFGYASVPKQSLITVVEGTYHTCVLPSAGIELSLNGTDTLLALNTSQAGTCEFITENGTPVITCVPPGDSGMASIRFLGDTGNEFSYCEDGVLTGTVRNIVVTSGDLHPANFSQKAGSGCFFNFTLNMIEYEPGRSIRVAEWEGSTPDDLSLFDDIKTMYNYGTIEDIAYTVRFEAEPPEPAETATLIFGVNSEWVRTFGWGDKGTLMINSLPEGARVYIDGNYAGFSPVNATGLAPGLHNVMLMKRGYYDYNLSMEVKDERDSIHVIRIGDDGNGQVLDTRYLGHDDERDLDLFMAESPSGLSTFGLASLSKSGNFFQMLYLSISTAVSGGGGSGGGGGGGGDVAGPAATSTTIATVTGTPLQTPVPTQTTAEADVDEAPGTVTQTAASTGQAEETTLLSGGDQGETVTGALTQGTSTLVLLKNLSVVFGVVLVTLVFYMRWNKREH
jgi:beta propeller repeat protein